MGNKGLHMTAYVLVLIGGLNWLLVGLLKWDIGALFGGMDSLISRIIYILVGLSAVYLAVTHKKKMGMSGGSSNGMGGSGMKM